MTRLRLLLVWATIVPLLDVHAQTLVSPALQDDKPTPLAAADDDPQVLEISAAAETDPALRYRFWPAPENRTDENPIPFISRATILWLQHTNDPEVRKKFADQYNRWSEMSLAELPVDELHQFLDPLEENVFRELARSQNHMGIRYDLNFQELSAPEMIQTLLPEFQEMRQLGRLLQLRARLAASERRYGDMVDDLRVSFRLAEVAGHSTDFLIGRLVGFAISAMSMDVIREAIQQPDCPNLYWALASLPEHALFETRESIEYESVLITRLTNRMAPLPEHPIGADAARQRIETLANDANLTMAYGGIADTNDFQAKIFSGVYVVMMAEPSRDLLATTTPWGERARSLSAAEAVLRATILKTERIRDRWVKWSLLPTDVWAEYEPEQLSALGQETSGPDVVETLMHNLMPAVAAARRAGLRTLQTRNLLISIEALRMHAARHGQLPETIEKLRPVPCWNDGFTMAPFGYVRTSTDEATMTRHRRWPADPDTIIQIKLTKGN